MLLMQDNVLLYYLSSNLHFSGRESKHLRHIQETLPINFICLTSKVTAPQDAHKRLVLQVAEGLSAEFKGGARHELTIQPLV